MNNKPIIALLVKRTVSFFFAICVLTFFLYGIGTDQGFMDTTQSNLLHLSVIFGLFLGVGSLYGIILDCILLVQGANSARETKHYAGDIGAYIVIGLLGFAMAAAAAFILVVAEGNG
ncbi:MAG: hypothetical protein LBJ41_06135 [Treponema sp.]|jgi:hypothetical protein|nr:hypothetical protein [Treponema sp.]